jgi:hypothetical protein
LLAAEDQLRNQLTVVTFDTFPEMESAFDRGEVDGVLLDDVLKGELRDAISIDGIQKTNAWKAYHEDANALGFPKEQFAIAVVLDVNNGQDQPRESFFEWVGRLYATPEDKLAGESSLYAQLQRALRSNDVQDKLLPKLRERYRIPSSPIR